MLHAITQDEFEELVNDETIQSAQDLFTRLVGCSEEEFVNLPEKRQKELYETFMENYGNPEEDSSPLRF